MRSEKEFSAFVFKELKDLYVTSDLEISEGKNILTDITCVFENGQFELIHGFSQTDIAISKEVKFDMTNHLPSFIRFYGDKEIRQGNFSVPFIILELKCGDVTTDSIRSRDFVASRIREMFPFCAYYLLAENTKKEEKTVLRQGKSFTNYFIFKTDITKEGIREIFTTYIKPHIENVKRQFHSS